MEKMLERAIMFAFQRAMTLGADEVEARETALAVLYDACPDMEEDEARAAVAAMSFVPRTSGSIGSAEQRGDQA